MEDSLRAAKKKTIANLKELKENLSLCVDEGMIDEKAKFYNEILDLIDDASIVESWEELREAISMAQTIEADIATWFSFHGKTTFSLSWPILK